MGPCVLLGGSLCLGTGFVLFLWECLCTDVKLTTPKGKPGSICSPKRAGSQELPLSLLYHNQL